MRRAFSWSCTAALLTLAACSQSGTGVLLTINGAGVMAEQLSIAIGNETHLVPATAAPLHFPSSVVLVLPDRATTATVQVAALHAGISIAWGATAPLAIAAHEVVPVSIDLSPTVPPTGVTISPSVRFTIINRGSALCIAGATAVPANGIAVEQLTCSAGDTTQAWQFLATDGGYYRIVNVATNEVLGVAGGDSAVGNRIKVELATWMSGLAQQWRPMPSPTGYVFTARHSGLCLDVTNGVVTPGASLQQSDCNGSSAQAYQLTAL
jgi:hypothetical protein